MKLPSPTTVARMLLLVACVALNSCQSRKTNTPSIEFTKIPQAEQGGPENVGTIAGRVHGSRAGEQIVIYAHSGPWWVQPYYDHPFVPIQSDETWSPATHLGLEYAALLVDAGYHPSATLDMAPAPGGSVISVAFVK